MKYRKMIYALILAAALLSVTSCDKASFPVRKNIEQAEETPASEEPSAIEEVETEEDNDKTSAEVSPDADYEDVLESIVEERSASLSDSVDELMESVGDSYESYEKNKDRITDWYGSVLNESEDLYNTIKEMNIEKYKEIAERLKADDSFDWQKEMDDIYDAWDDAMGDYYDAWADAYGDVYDKWDKAIHDNSVDYKTSSEAWSDAYSTHSDFWSKQYAAHSDSWSELYGDQTEVWSGFFSGNTDINEMIKNAEKSSVSGNEDNSADEKTDDSAAQDEDEIRAGDKDSLDLSDDLVRDDVKEAIDSYEAFVDEYCDFMEKYDPSDIKSLTEYTELMTKEIEMTKEFDDIEDKDLTDAEALYYSEVSLRCSGKLMEAASKMK